MTIKRIYVNISLMIKNKILSKKIIKIIIAVIFVIILQKITTLIPNSMFSQFIEPTITQMIIALFAGFYGSIIGFMIGFLGKFIGYFNFNGIVIHGLIMNFYEYLQFGLYGLFIGFFWKKNNFSESSIRIKGIISFCIIQIISNLIFLEIIGYIMNNLFSFFKETWLILIVNKIIWTIPYIIFFIVFIKIRKNKNGNEVRPNCI